MNTSAQQQTQRSEHIDRMTEIFSENMMALKKYLRPVFDYYSKYTPSTVRIDMDPNGYLNLRQGENWIYPGDPKIAHQQQFKLFKSQPRHFRFMPNITKIKRVNRRRFLHSHFLSEIDQLGQSVAASKSPEPTFVPTLLLLGIGMGYHLEHLVDHYDIRNLLIYEPNPDVFFAALFIIRLTPILEHFTSGTNSITIKIDGSPNEFCNEVAKLSATRGTFNVSRVYLYRHYNSISTDETFKRLGEIMHRLMQGWGFFEDEIISLNHTSINAKQAMRFIRNHSPTKNDRPLPAFIVANGPSLDKDLEYIKAHQDSAIIFSAGSTIFTLYKAGIVPDFHVDIERTLGPKDPSDTLPLSYREKITFLTLNTSHPAVVELFPKRAFCLKANDAGTELIESEIPRDCQSPLRHCNPLSGNGTLAFALRLGFKDIVFFGLDMGAIEKDKHHATGSSYYTPGHRQYQRANTGTFKIKQPCNRGGEMFTSEILDFSRYSIEAALEQTEGVKAKNCSIGLEIHGCEVTDHDHLNLANKPSVKSELLSTIEEECFVTLNGLDERKSLDFPTLVNQTKQLADLLLNFRDPAPTGAAQTLNFFAEQLVILERYQDKQSIATRMWLGTLRYLHCNIATWLVDLKDDDECTKNYIKDALKVMEEYIKTVQSLFADNTGSPWADYVPEEWLERSK